MQQIATIDIGGTHLRFALAEIEGGQVRSLGDATTFDTVRFASLALAWDAYRRQLDDHHPDGVAISFAGPVHGESLKLTNNPWVIQPAQLARSLGVGAVTLINDFAAVGHAVGTLGPDAYQHICGPDVALPAEGTISIVGPGTGLGVAHVLRWPDGYHVSETEGGHMDFAALDQLEDGIVAALRARFGRVSAERMVAGPGLGNIYRFLAAGEGGAGERSDEALWAAAIGGAEPIATAALERYCLALGAVCGDVTLAQGGTGCVLAGGVGFRLADILAGSGFVFRFRAKGRFEAFMSSIPVKVLRHPQPGLLGAAAAYAAEHRGLTPDA